MAAIDGQPEINNCYYWNFFATMGMGFLVTGPYSLITTAVSAELGQHPSLRGSSQALATVTAIIDGTGSIGAAIGPFLAGTLTANGTNLSPLQGDISGPSVCCPSVCSSLCWIHDQSPQPHLT
jgi:MFS family permease